MGTKARRLRRGVPGERGWIPRGWAEIAGLLAAMVEGGDIQRRCALSVFVAHFRVPSVCDVFSLCGACAEGAAAAGAAASAGDGSVCFRAERLRGLLSGEGLRLPCMNAHKLTWLGQPGGKTRAPHNPLARERRVGGSRASYRHAPSASWRRLPSSRGRAAPPTGGGGTAAAACGRGATAAGGNRRAAAAAGGRRAALSLGGARSAAGRGGATAAAGRRGAAAAAPAPAPAPTPAPAPALALAPPRGGGCGSAPRGTSPTAIRRPAQRPPRGLSAACARVCRPAPGSPRGDGLPPRSVGAEPHALGGLLSRRSSRPSSRLGTALATRATCSTVIGSGS